MQVSYYGGKYSIHRALALNELVTTISLERALLICAATPLPMVALVFGLWIRTAVMVGISTHAIVVQMTYLIDNFTVPMSQMLQLVPSAVVGLAMLVAEYLVFPIPFFVLLVMPVFFILLTISLRVILGARGMRHILSHRKQLLQCIRFICSQASTIVIFPAYEMFFGASQGTKYQLVAILLLPVIKVVAKNVVLHFAKDLEDMVLVEVIFTADFFNAVYVATCMQNATSTTAIFAISITDLSQTIVMLYKLQRRTITFLWRLRKTLDNAVESDDMLALICLLCRNPTNFRKQSHAGIRKKSCLPHHISMASKKLLDSLDDILKDHVMRPTILVESLETLLTTECLLITAYLEAFLPLFYCCYLLVMTQLPNAKFHTEMTGVNRENVVATILPLLIFGLLQIVSFVLLVEVIRRNCGMRALYQLAFVLTTQRSLVLCKMLLWMVITLSFRVIHFGKSDRLRLLDVGVDFKFEYIRRGFPRLWTPLG
ncbi:uncharacterized protein PITG_15284 [Phytophthora infestans T30-4]|uniref:Transmembrane protein n=1 Tax=Phytophthora infestans (strain T30-4) TaxID=403677 RepID=D0NQC0_PHYIT|nr:uncharacterized protein PITG_15284 [Phytophthora infestans T30-4]EEY62852.1 conserved hypothetical protein [Phytophthora infestans T30-4]|eukprot:XP_002898727.1 conserved hypothetical protein [Phytophthora infestans T30-4]